MTTGQKLRELRQGKGLTQQELASAIRINVRTIQRIENDEVVPRKYSLKLIAQALDTEISVFENCTGSQDHQIYENKKLLIWLHLSGVLLLPTVAIWYFEKDRIKGVNEHGIEIINFQLTMLVILLPLLFTVFIPVLIAIFTIAVVILNTVRVTFDRPFHYPFTISFLKTKTQKIAH
jgi:transcriptional regulator with XRE-family HTH domain